MSYEQSVSPILRKCKQLKRDAENLKKGKILSRIAKNHPLMKFKLIKRLVQDIPKIVNRDNLKGFTGSIVLYC